MPPKISVIIPVYNGEKYLRETLESIIHQTFRNFELLIIDDASTDGSLSILDEYANDDDRIRVFANKQNKGISETTNFGIEHAKGEFIALSDQDDVSLLNRFTEQIDFLESNPNHADNVSKKYFELQRQETYEIIRCQVLRIIGERLTDEIISGILFAKHQKTMPNIDNINTAWNISRVLTKLVTEALRWEMIKGDRFIIKRNAASRLRRIWREQKFHPYLIPFAIFSVILDPNLFVRTLGRLVPKSIIIFFK